MTTGSRAKFGMSVKVLLFKKGVPFSTNFHCSPVTLKPLSALSIEVKEKFCGKNQFGVKLKNSTPKSCWSTLGYLSANSSWTVYWQTPGRFLGELFVNSTQPNYCLPSQVYNWYYILYFETNFSFVLHCLPTTGICNFIADLMLDM